MTDVPVSYRKRQKHLKRNRPKGRVDLGLMVLAAIAILFLVAVATAAFAQTTIRPNGFGGYNAYTPAPLGSGTVGGWSTTITPNGFGGYNTHTQPPIGQGFGANGTIQPDGFGGYRVNDF